MNIPGPTRRSLLTQAASLAGLGAFAGCTPAWLEEPRAATKLGVDIHAHVFNGRDVPVVGFLQQTVVRDPHHEVDPDFLSTAFLKLLARILLSNTPTAERELARLRRGGIRLRSGTRVLAEDQANVAAALEAVALEGQARPEGRAGLSEEQILLSKLAAELEIESPRLLTPRAAAAQAQALAARIYETAEPPGRTLGDGSRSYRFLGPAIQTIRWAGLLTRSRTDILAELISLYGADIAVFSPSIVDFEKWFVTRDPNVSDIRVQIDLFSEIARRSRRALVLNFAPFCPLRAALDREDDPGVDTLANVRHAVFERGFAGVKLYPPMGFRPIGNNADVSRWAPRAPRGGGRALDAELMRLYAWCVEHEVPIKAHANNSVAAGPNTGRFADPEGWRRVLRRSEFATLRLNLAHFGGFDESETGGRDWEETMARMVRDHPNAYFDLGYWTEGAGLSGGDSDRVIARTAALIGRVPEVKTRMMYGSDWSMIGRVPNHDQYLARLKNVLGRLLPDPDDRDAVMGGNALAYLGLTRPGPQRARLDKFFGDHPVYRRVLAEEPA